MFIFWYTMLGAESKYSSSNNLWKFSLAATELPNPWWWSTNKSIFSKQSQVSVQWTFSSNATWKHLVQIAYKLDRSALTVDYALLSDSTCYCSRTIRLSKILLARQLFEEQGKNRSIMFIILVPCSTAFSCTTFWQIFKWASIYVSVQ